VILTLGSFGVARMMYKDARSTLPQRILAHPNPTLRWAYNLVYNKYYVDEAYDFLIVARLRGLARFLFAFDQRIIDGLVNLAGTVGRLVGTIDGIIDAVIVDGAVNGVAALFSAAGRWVRRTQTGRIQTYLVGAVAGVIALVFINFVVFQLM
jgi:NADH-quinone oxidoreductase subunit L